MDGQAGLRLSCSSFLMNIICAVHKKAVDQITINIKHKQVCMTRKCHNHTLQTNPWHHEEETQNTYSHMISKSNQLSRSHPDDFKTRNNTKC